MIDSTSEPQTGDSLGDDSSLRLHQAIERLYEVFAGYPPNLEGCPHCVTEEMKEPLRSKPLRELTSDDLYTFHMKVMTTWSDEGGFRHFLPRVLELVATDVDSSLDLCTITNKLFYAEWMKWPITEKEAIGSFLSALWAQLIRIYPSFPPFIQDTLDMIIGIAEDIGPYLQVWSNEKSGAGALHIGETVYRNSDGLLEFPPRLPRTWWDMGNCELKEINRIIQWLLEPERLACLRNLRETPPSIPLDFDLEKAIQTLEILQGEREQLIIESKLDTHYEHNG
jgi:hypothetical protein